MERSPSSSLYINHSPQGSRQNILASSSSPKPRVESETTSTSDQALQYATKEMILENLFQTPNGISDNWEYRLEVAQQPIRARMCGFGEKDRRSISPLPFVKLHITENSRPVNI
ncbi:13158_t:CDS:2, partial [Acaulospora colombiana]